ncbi:E3 ubiquitin/ISG15 ligase TRIM25 [Bombina bombina]|uniref:E3 ubiquitin/ISG15 ligase TRIM25 n=1 Tax=Bombina bombina TaxID=8345 RepID=UPI00235B2062|nr:E3 ubiquitin/ISG15 ligase TRIM25 [Bombina bombina]
MAGTELEVELKCSICMSIFTDPVTLTCGHTFCLDCITKTWKNQEKGESSCPECRHRFKTKPDLKRNMRMCSLANSFRVSVHVQTGIFCAYCIQSNVPATKFCLHCEASLCVDHVLAHNKSEEHVLADATTPWVNKKCQLHNKLVKYYCAEDAVCICVSCKKSGQHKGHQVLTLHEASEKRKETFQNVLKRLTTKRKGTKKNIQHLQTRRKELQEKSTGETVRVAEMFRYIRRKVDDLEKQVLSEITQGGERVLLQVSNRIQQLENEKNELTREIHHIEELCNLTDPFTVLQEQILNSVDYCDSENGGNEDNFSEDYEVLAEDYLDKGLISVMLHKGLNDIMTDVKVDGMLYAQQPSDLSLDINTAGYNVAVSGDLKMASWLDINYQPPRSQDSFAYCQVISTRGFCSGCYYWVVETAESGGWKVGMSYPSIPRRRSDQSLIGMNDKSWCLSCSHKKQYSVIHNSVETSLSHKSLCTQFVIFLDYKTGRLSFYELCDPIRHLHTFTATFTEPLYAAIWLFDAWVRIGQ